MNILVCGGAGYIGSHCVRMLEREGHTPVVYDNLVYGHREAVEGSLFFEGDISDRSRLAGILAERKIDLVMHYAAYAYVGESVENPRKYYLNNVAATLNLLEAMLDAGVDRIIFSSSCSTYGIPHSPEIEESHPQDPINPYGMTKFIIERVLEDYRRAYGLKYVSVRYFNAAGADPAGEIGEDHDPETHLIPIVLQTALRQRPHVRIFGTDYETPDGTCIRDYIHVNDIAEAHVIAMNYLVKGGDSGAFNLGNGKGYSVREVVETARKITGCPISALEVGRRLGDPARLVAAADRALRVLGWKPRFPTLENILSTAWKWHSGHPMGFRTHKTTARR